MHNAQADSSEEYFIDLRQLVQVLWRGKGILLAFFLFFTLGAGAVSLWVMPREYQTSTLVTVEFPRVPTLISTYLPVPYSIPDLRTLVAGLSDDEILNQVAASEGMTAADLRGHVRAEMVGYHGVRLIVRDTDPQRAARLTKHWAALVEKKAREMYGLDEMEAQWQDVVNQAKTEMLQAGQNLSGFWNGERVRQRLAWSDIQGYYSFLRSQQRALEAAAAEAHDIREKLQGQGKDATVTPEVAARLWALVMVGWASVGKGSLPPRVTLALSTPPSDLTVGQALAELDAIEQAITVAQARVQENRAKTAKQAEELGKTYLQGSTELQQAQTQWANTWSNYVRLRNQERWFRQMKRKGAIVHVISPARVPKAPVSPRTKANIVLGALLGLTLGATVVLLKAWWEKSL